MKICFLNSENRRSSLPPDYYLNDFLRKQLQKKIKQSEEVVSVDFLSAIAWSPFKVNRNISNQLNDIKLFFFSWVTSFE